MSRQIGIRTPPKSSKNAKGKMMSLLASSPDGRELKQYVDNGAIGPSMTPAQVAVKFPQFRNFEYNSFAGALRRARNTQVKQMQDRQNIGEGCKLKMFKFNVFV